MKPSEIDFDSATTVLARKDETVEVTVGQLALLLNFFYTGGGEPDSRNERMKCVIDSVDDCL